MEVENIKNITSTNQHNTEFDNIFESLVSNNEIIFKNQQRDEIEPSITEKTEIVQRLFDKNKTNFLLKFGKYLTLDELEHFKQFTKKEIEPELYEEVRLVLNDLQRNFSNGKKMEIKNRRYMALQKLIAEESYFSELEMMKRNPLLYDQLVGQYLSEKEKRERDSFTSCESITLVKILLETIDREDAESCRKRQEQEEIQIRSSDSDSDSSSEDCRAQDLISVSFDGARPSTSQWGEFESEQKPISSRKFRTPMITAEERLLLKQEFVTTMYQNFLDGKDKEFFDYSTVDTNSGYNNDGEMDHDAEDKYFDTEDVGNVEMLDEANADESSEDELDVYMKALNQHQSICDLAKDMKRNL